MRQQKPTFRFHNPNTPEETAAYLLSLLLEANQWKLEQALQEIEARSKQDPRQVTDGSNGFREGLT